MKPVDLVKPIDCSGNISGKTLLYYGNGRNDQTQNWQKTASNISTDDIESHIKLMIDNGILENWPSNQGSDSFFILNLNIPISPSRNDIEFKQLELGFIPSLATWSQVNFSVETQRLMAKCVAVKD